MSPDVVLDLNANAGASRAPEGPFTMAAAVRSRAPRAPCTWAPTRHVSRVLAIVLCTVVVAGCEQITPILDDIADNVHTLEVVNRCSGPNATVDLYLNDAYTGTVYYRSEFTIMSGPLTLRAVGTGPGGSAFTNATNVRADLVWTLCSGAGLTMDPGPSDD